jgi:hypothetical protein
MSPQLRDALRAAADEAGCSLNAFAVQVLAAAAGDPARFRQSADRDGAGVTEPADLERDALGYPLRWNDRWNHSVARNAFIGDMTEKLGATEMVALVKQHDANDPEFFVEWLRLRDAESAGRQSGGRRGAA